MKIVVECEMQLVTDNFIVNCHILVDVNLSASFTFAYVYNKRWKMSKYVRKQANDELVSFTYTFWSLLIQNGLLSDAVV